MTGLTTSFGSVVYCGLVGGVAQSYYGVNGNNWVPPKTIHNRCDEHGSDSKNTECNKKRTAEVAGFSKTNEFNQFRVNTLARLVTLWL